MKKIVIAMVVFMSVFISSKNVVYANVHTVPGVPDLTTTYEYVLILVDSSGDYLALCSLAPLRKESLEGAVYSMNYGEYRIIDSAGSWVKKSNIVYWPKYTLLGYDEYSIYYSNHDIYNLDGTSILFQSGAAKPTVEPTAAPTAAPTVTPSPDVPDLVESQLSELVSCTNTLLLILVLFEVLKIARGSSRKVV